MYGYNTNYDHGYMTKDEEREVDALVVLFRNKGFSESAQVSRYIRDNKLGFQFQNISGYLELTRDDDGVVDSWTFEGGIKPKFYREVCHRLGIGNRGSRARVTGFESYRQREFANLV